MIKISEAVKEIVNGDEIALEALRNGILNLSAYARKIHSSIEQKTMKAVREGTIVIALARLSANVESLRPLRANIIIQDLSIKSPLSELTYEKNLVNLEKLRTIPKDWFESEFLTITEGVREITIICIESLQQQLTDYMKTGIKGKYTDLVGITVRFKEEDYVEEPNMIYTLVSALASKRVNLIEIISTFTEITFVVRKHEMNTTIDLLKRFFPVG